MSNPFLSSGSCKKYSPHQYCVDFFSSIAAPKPSLSVLGYALEHQPLPPCSSTPLQPLDFFYRILQNPYYCKKHDSTGYKQQNNSDNFPCSELDLNPQFQPSSCLIPQELAVSHLAKMSFWI
jgi:hypothetical protein